LCIIFTTLINVIFQWFKEYNVLLNDGDILKLNMEYYPISLENIEHWAKMNDLHHKVPENMWNELRIALEKCKVKNYNVKITLNILKIRNNNMQNLIKINEEIIKLLKK
jgi:hypothetical protein